MPRASDTVITAVEPLSKLVTCCAYLGPHCLHLPSPSPGLPHSHVNDSGPQCPDLQHGRILEVFVAQRNAVCVLKPVSLGWQRQLAPQGATRLLLPYPPSCNNRTTIEGQLCEFGRSRRVLSAVLAARAPMQQLTPCK